MPNTQRCVTNRQQFPRQIVQRWTIPDAGAPCRCRQSRGFTTSAISLLIKCSYRPSQICPLQYRTFESRGLESRFRHHLKSQTILLKERASDACFCLQCLLSTFSSLYQIYWTHKRRVVMFETEFSTRARKEDSPIVTNATTSNAIFLIFRKETMGFRQHRAKRSAIEHFEESFIKLMIKIHRAHLLGENSV